MTREEVYKLIDGERDYQDKITGDRIYIANKSVAEELLLLEEYVSRSRKAWTDNAGSDAASDIIRKIAGIAVRCMEHNGAPARKV